uniref:Opioid receptor, kappa 1 n=1 Tax=Neogobius melanostomus TaxID=47308 RepID=A0A8C6WW18_9GOBI
MTTLNSFVPLCSVWKLFRSQNLLLDLHSIQCIELKPKLKHGASPYSSPGPSNPLNSKASFCRYTKMKTATNIYIFNLAVADALVTTTMPFQSTDYLLNSWPFGEVACKVFISIDYYNMFTSIFTLTMMSVDRYIAVCHPVKALDFRTPLKAKIINVFIWVLSSAAVILIYCIYRPTEGYVIICAMQFPDPYPYWDTLMKICVFIFAFVAPVIIITVCYTLMVLRLKNRNLRRITRLVLVVVAVFVICWTPIHIFILVKALSSNVPETTAVTAAYFFCVALGYTNSSLNPILYAFLDENFKRCFRDFCSPSGPLLSSRQQQERQAASARMTSHVLQSGLGGLQ